MKYEFDTDMGMNYIRPIIKLCLEIEDSLDCYDNVKVIKRLNRIEKIIKEMKEASEV